MSDFTDPVAWQAIGAAVVGLGAALHQYVKRKSAERGKIAEIARDARIAADEVQVNSGRSLKDHALRVEAAVNRIDDRTREIARQTTYLHETLFHLGSHNEVALFWTDIEGRNLDVNHFYSERLGCDRTDLIGRSWQSFVVEEDRKAYVEAFERAVAIGARFKRHLRIRAADGVVFAKAWAQPVWAEHTDADDLSTKIDQDGRRYSIDRYIGGWQEIDEKTWRREVDALHVS